MLGKVIRIRSDSTVTDGNVEVRKVYRLHEKGVSYTTMKRPAGASKWTSTSTSEIPLPAPLMEMMVAS